MDFLKKNWWKLLPFVLFFFGVGGILAFTALLIMYLVFRAASSLPVSPKRGRLLTWLIVIEVVVLAAIIVSGVMTHNLGQISSIVIFLEAVWLLGIWQWKKVAVIGFIGLFVFNVTKDFVAIIIGHHYPSIIEATKSLWLMVIFLFVWLGLWVKAFKQKWSMFT